MRPVTEIERSACVITLGTQLQSGSISGNQFMQAPACVMTLGKMDAMLSPNAIVSVHRMGAYAVEPTVAPGTALHSASIAAEVSTIPAKSALSMALGLRREANGTASRRPIARPSQ